MRINQDKRKYLANKIADKKFDDKINAARALEKSVARKIYDLLLGDVYQKVKRSNIPIEFIHHQSRIDIAFPTAWYKRFKAKYNAKVYTSGENYYRSIKLGEALPVPGGYPNLEGCTEELYFEFCECEHSRETLEKAKTGYAEELRIALAGANTLKQLKEQFPDVVEFIPANWERKPKADPPAPKDIIASLDERFGV